MSDYQFTYDEEILTLLRDVRDPLVNMRDDMGEFMLPLLEIRSILYLIAEVIEEGLSESVKSLESISDDMADGLVETTTADSGDGVSFLDGLLGSFDNLMETLSPFLSVLKPFAPLIKLLKAPFEMLVKLFVAQFYPIIVALLPFLYDLVEEIAKLFVYLTPIITAIASWISENVTLENVINGLITAWAWLKEVLDPIANLIVNLYNAFKDLFNGLKEGDMSAIGTFVRAILDAIVKYFTQIIDEYKTAIIDLGKKVLTWWMTGASPDNKSASSEVVWYNPFTWFNQTGGSSMSGEGRR
jgi:phage-related protein